MEYLTGYLEGRRGGVLNWVSRGKEGGGVLNWVSRGKEGGGVLNWLPVVNSDEEQDS